jgi:hypothetical protein
MIARLLRLTTIAALVCVASEPSAAPPPKCSNGANARAYNAGLAAGREMTNTAWERVGRDPDRIEELKPSIVAGFRAALPHSNGRPEACRFGGVVDGSMAQLVMIQDTVVRQCILDGATWGTVAAELYCGLAIEFGGLALGLELVRSPVGICGTNYEQSCDATLADAVLASPACRRYAEAQFANAFAQYQNNQCMY